MVLVFLFLLLIAGGCSHVGPRETSGRPEEQAADAGPVWPAGPEPPKIRYVSSIASSRDLKVAKSFFRHLGEFVLGESEERLVRPTGVAARGSFLAIADPGTPALFLFDRVSRSFRKVTQGDGTDLVSPVAVALAEADSVYLADSYLRQVFVYDSDGRLRDAWGRDDLQRPTGLAFDGRLGRLYVADAGAHRIVVYGPHGEQLFSFGERGIADGEFNWPSHLCLDRDGLVYVVDSLNFRVQVFDANGHFISKFGHHGDGSGDLSRPKGVGVDSLGHIYVVDALFDVVQIFDAKGEFLLGFGQQGIGPGEFWLPAGLAVDGDDYVFVADSYNQRVQVFQFVGTR